MWTTPADCSVLLASSVSILLAAAAAVTAVLMHYTGLRFLNRQLAQASARHQHHALIVTVSALLLLHLMEMLLFAGVIHGLTSWHCAGGIRDTSQGYLSYALGDAIYYSMTVYTSLGFGDLAPVGAMRFISGAEALLGLVMIGWSASFLYLEMQRFWPDRYHPDNHPDDLSRQTGDQSNQSSN